MRYMHKRGKSCPGRTLPPFFFKKAAVIADGGISGVPEVI